VPIAGGLRDVCVAPFGTYIRTLGRESRIGNLPYSLSRSTHPRHARRFAPQL